MLLVILPFVGGSVYYHGTSIFSPFSSIFRVVSIERRLRTLSIWAYVVHNRPPPCAYSALTVLVIQNPFGIVIPWSSDWDILYLVELLIFALLLTTGVINGVVLFGMWWLYLLLATKTYKPSAGHLLKFDPKMETTFLVKVESLTADMGANYWLMAEHFLWFIAFLSMPRKFLPSIHFENSQCHCRVMTRIMYIIIWRRILIKSYSRPPLSKKWMGSEHILGSNLWR